MTCSSIPQIAKLEVCITVVHQFATKYNLGKSCKTNAIQFSTGREKCDVFKSFAVCGTTIQPFTSMKSPCITFNEWLSLDMLINKVRSANYHSIKVLQRVWESRCLTTSLGLFVVEDGWIVVPHTAKLFWKCHTFLMCDAGIMRENCIANHIRSIFVTFSKNHIVDVRSPWQLAWYRRGLMRHGDSLLLQSLLSPVGWEITVLCCLIGTIIRLIYNC